MRQIYLWLCVVGLLLTGCGQQASRREINAYFDFRELFGSQVRALRDYSFEKSALIDGKSEAGTVQFDTTGWKKELSMFMDIDINKAALVGAYEEESETTAAGTMHTYTLKPGQEESVKWIKLEKDSEGKVQKVAAQIKEDNVLYHNQRELSAVFENTSGQPLLMAYRVKGYQKILTKDTVHYEIEARRAN